jgi:hypothetical protein
VIQLESKRKAHIAGIEQHIAEVMAILDTNATCNSDGGSSESGDDVDRKRPKSGSRKNFVIDTETIFRGFKICEDEMIEGTVKAKLYARLIREYRRSLEHAKREAQREQRNREIEKYIEKRFPNLSPNQSMQILDQKSPGKPRKVSSTYNSRNLDIEEEFKEEDASSGFYAPKIMSSESTVGPNGTRQPKYPLR